MPARLLSQSHLVIISLISYMPCVGTKHTSPDIVHPLKSSALKPLSNNEDSLKSLYHPALFPKSMMPHMIPNCFFLYSISRSPMLALFLLGIHGLAVLLMRTSCRLGADSIEYTSGSDAPQFFGFRLDLFQIYL